MNRLVFLPLIASIILLSGCSTLSTAPPTDGADAAAPTLRVAALPITDVVPFYVADAEGYFANAGVNVELIPVSSGAERDTVIQSGEAECELTDIHGVVLTNAGEARPLKVVSTARQATPDQPVFFLLTSSQSGINEPAQLVDATIAISENTIIGYWTDRMLTFTGVDAESVALTNVPQIPVRLELLLSGQVDAAVLPDPLASLAQMQGAALVLDDAANPSVSVSVIVCSQETIDAMPEAVEALLSGWDQAVAALNAEPEAYQNVLIENTRVPEPLQDQYALPQFTVESIPTEAQVADVVKWAKSNGLIETELAFKDVVDASFRQ